MLSRGLFNFINDANACFKYQLILPQETKIFILLLEVKPSELADQNNKTAEDAGRDVITVLGIAVLVLLISVTAAFVWHGRRHVAAFSCCLSHQAKAMLRSAAKRMTSPPSLPISGSQHMQKHSAARQSANDRVTLKMVRDSCAKRPLSVSSSSAPIGSRVTGSFQSASHGFTTLPAASATSRCVRLNDARCDVGRRATRSTRTSSLDRSRRGYRVKPFVDDDENAMTTCHVMSDSCVNLAVSHVTASGDEDGLRGVAVFVAGECGPHRLRHSQC